MRYKLLSLLVLITVLGTPACESRSLSQKLSCEQFLSSELRALPGRHFERSQLDEWITTHYPAHDIDTVGETVVWGVQDMEYRAELSQKRVEGITVWWRSGTQQGPRAADIIRCLGEPEGYRALYTRQAVVNELSIELWYPQQGIVTCYFTFGSLNNVRPPSIPSNPDFNTITIMEPALPLAMERQAIIPIPNTTPLAEFPLQPWPGDWETLSVVVDLEVD